MKLRKGFIQPIVLALVGALSASGVGFAGVVTEAYAPNTDTVIQIQEQKEDADLARGIVDGLTREQRAVKIDAYFAQWNLPLEGYGHVFVREADNYGHVDWRLIAAIGMRESTGCKFVFAKNNCFGWGKQVTFVTVEQAIADITKNLAGADEDTAYHYEGKDTRGILAKYNSVIPTYTEEILAIMKDIDSMILDETSNQLAQK
jgi:hypothetical protein